MKFKVGDKVVVSPKANAFLGGLSGIVIETQESPFENTTYYKVYLDEERVFPEHQLIDKAEYRFLTELNVTTDQLLATCGIKPVKALRAKDGTLIGEFNTGGVIEFKNGSSIKVIPNKDVIRSKEPELAWVGNIKLPTATEIKEQIERVKREFQVSWGKPVIPKEEKNLKFTFYFNVNEGTRVDKSCNGTIPTITTSVVLDKFGDPNRRNCYSLEGEATCDKADYDMRQGVLEALANAIFDGNFEKAYNKAVKTNAFCERQDRTCHYCGKVLDTIEEKQEHEAWHVERKKARRERYLLRKRAKEIAFEEQAQKMAKEMTKEDK